MPILQMDWKPYKTPAELMTALKNQYRQKDSTAKEMVDYVTSNPRTTPLIVKSTITGAIIKCNGDGTLYLLEPTF